MAYSEKNTSIETSSDPLSIIAQKPSVTIVIPCFRSQDTIGEVVRLTHDQLSDRGYPHSFVLVNDCSGAQTFDAIVKLSEEYDCVKGLDLAKNVGQQVAVLAGLRASDGDYTVVMDDDLQTHPSQIIKLIEPLEQGYDLVFAQYPSIKEGLLRRTASLLSSTVAPLLTGRPKTLHISSFYAMTSLVREKIVSYAGLNANVQAMAIRVTSKYLNVEVQHFERAQGVSGYTFAKLIRAWASLLNYSDFAAKFSLSVTLASGVLAIALLLGSIVGRSTVLAIGSLAAFLSSLNALTISMIAVQMSQTLFSQTSLPQYTVRAMVGFDESELP